MRVNSTPPELQIVCQPADETLLQQMFGEFQPIAEPASGFYLTFEDDVLKLFQAENRQGVWVHPAEIDRRLAGRFLLGRACGLGKPGLQLIDATGGMGVDALALHRRGADVRIVEREPLLWALLKDLVRRLADDSVEVVLADSAGLLGADVDPCLESDVIYLDPMFPQRRKKALPGKRMQYLGALLAQADAFDSSLLDLARQQARSRVVLKRRLKDPELQPADWTLKGRSVRYDIYRGRG